MTTYIGIDNGVSGSVGIITPTEVLQFNTPVFSEMHFTKEAKFFTRVDVAKLEELLSKYISADNPLIYMERPMVNPKLFNSTASALRAYEATLIVLERLKIGRKVIDSKEWQKSLLPFGLKGPQLKIASLQVATQLYPRATIEERKIKRAMDGDGILIAEYFKRQQVQSIKS